MLNKIRSQGKIWKRRSKNLKSGEIECPRCGKWVKVTKFTNKHFTEEYTCRTCKKELGEIDKPKIKTKKKVATIGFPPNCPHKPFFVCKRKIDCLGCYYNPNKKIALMVKYEGDDKKTAGVNWFYGLKSHSKVALKLLDDIKNGKGRHKNGTKCYFKHTRKIED